MRGVVGRDVPVHKRYAFRRPRPTSMLISVNWQRHEQRRQTLDHSAPIPANAPVTIAVSVRRSYRSSGTEIRVEDEAVAGLAGIRGGRRSPRTLVDMVHRKNVGLRRGCCGEEKSSLVSMATGEPVGEPETLR